MTGPENQWIRDVPSNPMMQRQWSREPIPWCTTHDAQDMGDGDCYLTSGLPEMACHISTGGPDHKWWVDV